MRRVLYPLCLASTLSVLIAEDAPPAPLIPDTPGQVLIDLPPEPEPVVTGIRRPLALLPPPSKEVDLPIAPIEKHISRPTRSKIEPDASGSYGGFNDFRFGWTGGASAYTLANDRFNGPRDEVGDYDATGRIAIEWIGSPGMQRSGGFLLGAVAAYQWNEGKLSNASDFSVALWTIDLQAGYGVPIGRNFQLELVPFIGLGAINGSLVGINGPETNSGIVFEWGLHLNGVYTFDGGFQIGATGGFLGFSGTLQDASYTNSESYTLTASGLVGGVFVGLRL